MKKGLLFFSIFTLTTIFTSPVYAWWWGKPHQPTLEQVIDKLQKKQVHKPNDPYINYNLGVALHKAKKFDAASANFDRASIGATDQELKKRCFFNLGNTLVNDALTILPTNWETTNVPPETLDTAITKINVAIKKYDNVLMLDKQHNPAQANKKAAQELIEKLEKKKQQQAEKNNQKQDKKDRQEEKKQYQEKQSEKSPKSQGEQNSQDKNSQYQPNKDDRKDRPQDVGDKGQDGENKPPDQDRTTNNQQQNTQRDRHDQTPEQKPGQPTPTQGNETGEQKQDLAEVASEEKSPESMEQRGMRALLDNLQQDEAKLQKALIVKQLKHEGKPQESSQRPW